MSGTVTWGDALWLARHRTPNDRLRFWGSAVSSAITAALLCTALGLMSYGADNLMVTIGVIADSGTRGGAAFAVLLVSLPALHLTARPGCSAQSSAGSGCGSSGMRGRVLWSCAESSWQTPSFRWPWGRVSVWLHWVC